METGRYAGLDTGMNSLLCPALYGAHHEIVKLSRLGEAPSLTAGVVGPICETGDGPGHDRRLPPPSRAIHCSWRRRGPTGQA
jgi:diaminopimelate decarboxylase/aspartate kinase